MKSDATPLSATATDSAVEQPTNSRIVKRSIRRNGYKSSISLEDPFWDGLREIAAAKKVTVSKLVATIKLDHKRDNLSSAIRVFVLEYFKCDAFKNPSHI